MERRLRVVIAEDSVLLREGLAQILERFGHIVVAAVGDAEALCDAVAEHRPDVVVTDVRMPPGFTDEGLRAALELRRERPRLPTVVLSQYVETGSAEELIATGGGVGYLLKDRIGEVAEFVDALRRVAAGGAFRTRSAAAARLLLSRRPWLSLTYLLSSSLVAFLFAGLLIELTGRAMDLANQVAGAPGVLMVLVAVLAVVLPLASILLSM